MVDWHEFNSSHHWELFLEDADGQPVCFDTPDGPQPIEVRGDFSAVAPDGVPVGTPVDVPICGSTSGRFLQDGSRFTWRLVIDGDSLPVARCRSPRARRFPSPSKSESTPVSCAREWTDEFI